MGNHYQPFSLRIPEEMIIKMKVIAAHNNRSANKEMERALRQYIEQWEKTCGPIKI